MKRDSKKASRTPSRDELLMAGQRALDQAVRFIDNRYTHQPDRQAWARVVGNLITAMGGLLKDAEVEDIEKRIAALEELVKNGEKA